jgi:hypothetical protein
MSHRPYNPRTFRRKERHAVINGGPRRRCACASLELERYRLGGSLRGHSVLPAVLERAECRHEQHSCDGCVLRSTLQTGPPGGRCKYPVNPLYKYMYMRLLYCSIRLLVFVAVGPDHHLYHFHILALLYLYLYRLNKPELDCIRR